MRSVKKTLQPSKGKTTARANASKSLKASSAEVKAATGKEAAKPTQNGKIPAKAARAPEMKARGAASAANTPRAKDAPKRATTSAAKTIAAAAAVTRDRTTAKGGEDAERQNAARMRPTKSAAKSKIAASVEASSLDESRSAKTPGKKAPANKESAKPAVSAEDAGKRSEPAPNVSAASVARFQAARTAAAAAQQKVTSHAATPPRAAAFSLSPPDPDEQDIVTKKVEKKAPALDAAVNADAPVGAGAAVEAAVAPVAAIDPKAALAKPAKPAGARQVGFKPNEFIVYPAHGVGQIVAIEEQEVAGFKLELFVISFIKDKMILKVPTPKVASVGMRKLAEADLVRKALDTLAGRARVKRTMWSRRAQEYEAKINSGDLIAIAEVVRDLYRSDSQPEQSYSERQLYEAALDRMAREVIIVQKLTETEALKAIEAQLQKGPRRGGKVEEIEAEEAEIEEAA